MSENTTKKSNAKKVSIHDKSSYSNHFIIRVSPHPSVKGGILLNAEGTDFSDSEEEGRARKIASILNERAYEKDLYPLELENVIAQSTLTHNCMKEVGALLPQKTIFISKNNETLKRDANHYIDLSFRLQKVNNEYRFTQLLQSNGDKIVAHLDGIKDYGIILADGSVHFWKNAEDMTWFIKTLDIQHKRIAQEELKNIFRQYVIPLQKNYIIHVDSQLIKEYVPKKKPPKVLLSITTEKTKISFQLYFLYNNAEVTPPALRRYYALADDNQYVIQIDRDKETEEYWRNELLALHSDFNKTGEFEWSIPISKVSKSWSNTFFDTLQEWDVQIKNNSIALQEHKLYTPSIQIKLINNANWFDAIIDIRIDNKTISVQEMQEAILSNKQEIYVDGNVYMLSKEWIRKHRNIFLWGKITKNRLRFSQYQDYLFEALNDAVIMDKTKPKQKIDKNVSLPVSLKGTLREYQKEGFQWMNILQQTGKGGILADDMGLGKTIQTLAQLLKFHETYSKLTSLIICPASLINNWKEEILKFTPDLKFLIYHSQERTISPEDIPSYQVVITSYNILQKDVKILQNINFDYIILDESQYIKNPYSKTARSAFSLNGKYRLCLSGTPLQNHTFDVFSQIHFINSNILGSIEHFKQRFAILIDHYEEKETISELRQLLDPFILRRTKKQVAKDLPEKTESIVYCTMEQTQREIYEYYRERHRTYLLDKIKKEGLQKSKFHVLQGLTFLRQICNSPLLVKEKIVYKETPIKLKILKDKMIDPNGENKALIFSQFIGMLSLIEQEVKKDKWNYAYFDGKTPLDKRTSEIHRFQTMDECKLFLISIKAGNVGLNLTSADYVFLIDPWWNPAIEQQAIDRTHRIGQKKNIFSFKFICSNTIEEKILLLQKKKSNLADNLILLNQNNLIKNLNSEDIEYLFSE